MKAWQGLTAIVAIVAMMVMGVVVQRRGERLLVLNQLADASFDEARRHHARIVNLRAEAEGRGCDVATPSPAPLSPRPAPARSRLEAEVRLDRARARATEQFSLWTALMATVGPCVDGWERRGPLREVEPWLPGLPAHRRPEAAESVALSFADQVQSAELLHGFVRSVDHLRATVCTDPSALVVQFKAELEARQLPRLYWAMLYEPNRAGETTGEPPYIGPFGTRPERLTGLGLRAGDPDPRLHGSALAADVASWLGSTQKRWSARGRPPGEAILLTLLSWRVGPEQVAEWLATSSERLGVHSAAITFVELEDTALASADEVGRIAQSEAFPYVPRVVAAAIVAEELCPPPPPEASPRRDR